jgi:hypothetical protein
VKSQSKENIHNSVCCYSELWISDLILAKYLHAPTSEPTILCQAQTCKSYKQILENSLSLNQTLDKKRQVDPKAQKTKFHFSYESDSTKATKIGMKEWGKCGMCCTKCKGIQ